MSLCVDKTGTITENTMKVQDVIETEEYDPETMEPLRTLIGDFAAAMTKDNITMAAVKEYFTTASKEAGVHDRIFFRHKIRSVTFEDEAYVLGGTRNLC